MAPKNNKRLNYADIENWFDRSFDAKRRIIYLSSINADEEGKETGIDAFATEFMVKGLHILNIQNQRARIRVVINSPGGDVIHGWGIYDAIRNSHAPVDTEVYGHAMSMAAVILQAGERRYLHPNSVIMIHDGTTSNQDMPIRSNEEWTRYLKEDRQKMYRLFAERSGRRPEYWSNKCRNDNIFSAEGSVKEGLADSIIPARRKLPKAPPRRKRKR
jgi:ATP-dependent Clp protease protease subunit